MAHKKRRSIVIQLKEVRTLRRKENFEDGELEEFFERRDAYIAAYGDKISDFLALSPMAMCRRWTLDEPETDTDFIK